MDEGPEARRVFYHYTSSRGLLGMFATGRLWFSDIRFLNDSAEFKHACFILADHVRRYAARHRERWLGAGCRPEAFDRMVEGILRQAEYERLYRRVSERQGGVPFTFSLSAARDSLSQWRAYGSAQYCVGFDMGRLRPEWHAGLWQVRYTRPGEDQPWLRDILDGLFTGHRDDIGADGRVAQEVGEAGFDAIFGAVLDGEFFLSQKDHGFRDEAEWRLVRYVDPASPEIFLDPSGRYATPRVALSPFQGEDGLVAAVTEVICGPDANEELARTMLGILGRKHGRPDLPVAFSSVPYRFNELG